MSIKNILPKFESLKASILSDGEIDIDEVNEMIEFIRPYCRDANMKFLQLMRILIMAKDDGKITELETRAIIEALDDVTRFLKYERIIGIIMATTVIALFCGSALWMFIR